MADTTAYTAMHIIDAFRVANWQVENHGVMPLASPIRRSLERSR